jgi:hypothetical protein
VPRVGGVYVPSREQTRLLLQQFLEVGLDGERGTDHLGHVAVAQEEVAVGAHRRPPESWDAVPVRVSRAAEAGFQ